MAALHYLTYLSTATHLMTQRELDQLLSVSRTNNQQTGISGVLLYHEGCFFQYIEGEYDALQLLFTHIKQDPRHHNIIELYAQSIPQRGFQQWYMGFTEVTHSELQQLAQADWQSLSTQLQPVSIGIQLLQNFWQRNYQR